MAKKSCKFGKVSRGSRKGQCRKARKTPKRKGRAKGYHLVTGGHDNMMLNGRRSRRR